MNFKPFTIRNRAEQLEQVQEKLFDLVIIGGGITGAGVARDAASRGMSVALVEASDFASGTSSRSSKLIHGGIRYLENLEFHLVFEALTERSRLFEMAPHLVHPLQFMIPIFQHSRVGRFKMGLGMWLYDLLALFQAPYFHENLGKAETLYRMPTLKSDDLLGSFTYSDAYMDDDRLTIETLRSAHQQGAFCFNYLKALTPEMVGGKIVAVECEDQIDQKKHKIKAKHFISTVGPWTDQVAHKMLPEWRDMMRPSKGIHLTFSARRVPLSSAVVMGAEERIVFGIPRHEMVIVGTTDTYYEGDPSEVSVHPEEVKYLLSVVNGYFPGLQLTQEDIVASYAGVRPLVDDGSSNEGKTSREHTIVQDPRNITFVTGGKYTTYRNMSEETVDKALNYFTVEDRVRFFHSQTVRPINPLSTVSINKDFSYGMENWAQDFGQPLSVVESLFSRHGGETQRILQKGLTEWQMEAHHAIDQTMCKSLVDFYFRRTPLYLSRPDHGKSVLSEVAKVFQEKMGWSEEQKKEEINALQNKVSRELSWKR